MPKSVVSWTEYHLWHPEKLETLTPAGRELFWSQRKWHPLVQMRWMNEIRSTGEGTLIFPDGSRHHYNGLTNQSQK